jgi:hypothetical protein
MRPESLECAIDQNQLLEQKNAMLYDRVEVSILRPGRRNGENTGVLLPAPPPHLIDLVKIGLATKLIVQAS